MIGIHQYTKDHQNDIDIMMNAVANEFEVPIINKNKSSSETLDAYWVACYRTEVIGSIGVLNIDSAFSVLKNMFVKKDYRGKDYGVAQLLLDKVYECCHTEGIGIIYLGTMDQFKAAHKFYEKNGFEKIYMNQLPISFIPNPIDDTFYIKSISQEM